ncbi:hypothetical protein D3C77_254640 [compost metagenome]
MLDDLGFAELPVGGRQHHDRIGAVGLGKARTADGSGSGQVRNADNGGYSLGNVRQAELGNLLPFQIAEVSPFTGAPQRRDGMYATGYQAVDGFTQRGQVELLAIVAERGDGVADDAVKSRGHDELRK